ncbi:GyrI-like domain-containing protein [Desulfuribacillus alkaliarsenatis]|uniref:Transcriptional regulator n=1 Tax=Desulfuribacillus alkaliarsenatis TaxID=766136 RepID=A0A1E5G2K4_9FIRM|nr:GyrI-like domain-containing protein [Desulfuribacillus alkaliarsenatis]OEF97174.1 transcriptional regulator [Desulfuribacillus alkaliarsenatis]
MTNKKIDYKKEYKELYLPKNKPMLIEVPSMDFIMVDGTGDPNNNPEFEHAVEVLYGLSYTIKMSHKKGQQPPGYYEYVVPPLEGLWWIEEGTFCLTERDNWKWTVMIRQPEFVNEEVFQWACKELEKKKPELKLELARFESFAEGLSVQMMHIGPYSTEPETVEIMTEYIKQQGLIDCVGIEGGKHHEIYISDPRKSKPESMKTVLRHPVKRARG